jgi:hypothetical protein
VPSFLPEDHKDYEKAEKEAYERQQEYLRVNDLQNEEGEIVPPYGNNIVRAPLDRHEKALQKIRLAHHGEQFNAFGNDALSLRRHATGINLLPQTSKLYPTKGPNDASAPETPYTIAEKGAEKEQMEYLKDKGFLDDKGKFNEKGESYRTHLAGQNKRYSGSSFEFFPQKK